MVNFFKKNRKSLLILLIIFGIYFILRLPNLVLQPIFADEAIYIRWSQVMKAESTMRFLPLSDGKTPLYMWALMPFFKIFSNPLFAGRFLSVLFGALTLGGAVFLGWKNFNKSVGIWAGFLVAVTPFMVFFDRMALVDSMLAAFSIWSLNFAIIFIRTLRFDLAMVLGYFLGAGWLTKTPGMFNLVILPVTLFAFNWRGAGRVKRLIRLATGWLIAVGIAFGMYNLLRLGPGFENLSSRNQDYIFSPFEILNHPLDPFIPHIKDVFNWFIKFIPLPTLILVICGAVFGLYKRNRFTLIILLWSAIPILSLSFLIKAYTSRYILFSIPPLLVLTGWFINVLLLKIKKGRLLGTVFIFLAILSTSLVFDIGLLKDPLKTNLPRTDMGYLSNWTAGYGFPEIAKYLIDKSSAGTVIVGTEGSFGTLPDGLMIYLDKHSHTASPKNQIIVIGGNSQVPQVIRDSASVNQTYFVANKSRVPHTPEGLKLIMEFPKIDSPEGIKDAILFFQVLPINK